jgi:hypothetical protein
VDNVLRFMVAMDGKPPSRQDARSDLKANVRLVSEPTRQRETYKFVRCQACVWAAASIRGLAD